MRGPMFGKMVEEIRKKQGGGGGSLTMGAAADGLAKPAMSPYGGGPKPATPRGRSRTLASWNGGNAASTMMRSAM